MDERRTLSRTFDESAAGYQAARPDYPVELFDDLITLTGLGQSSRLLEIGCGPGKATVPLAGRGYRITAVEPGERLAAEARRNLAGFDDVEVHQTSFEDGVFEDGDFEDREPSTSDGFDLIYAATSWHWLDPKSRWSKTAALLAPGGHLAVFGASHAFPPDFDPFFTDIQQVYDEIGEGMDGDWPPPPPDQLRDPTPDYEASGRFTVDAVRRYVWSQQYDADSYIALLNTFSGHIAMAPDARQRLFDEVRALLGRRPDGLLARHWVATLVIAHPGKR